MPAFEYQALDARGRSKSGMLEGDSARQVRQSLRDQGLAPTQVKLTSQVSGEEPAAANFFSRFFQPTLTVSERALITRQLATLIAAGGCIDPVPLGAPVPASIVEPPGEFAPCGSSFAAPRGGA